MTETENPGGGMGTDPSDAEDALVPRLRLIEDQPLDARAASFAQIHDELRARLEGGDAPVP